MSFLEDAVSGKAEEARLRRSFLEDYYIHEPKRRRSLLKALRGPGIKIIAEIKRRSPSEGDLNDHDIADIARLYDSAGVAAVSVLTDRKYFAGNLDDLKTVKDIVHIPVIRKDFIVDRQQIRESFIFGADAVLLIAAALKERLGEFLEAAETMGLEAIVEVHDADDLKYALATRAPIIGINNRDLKTLKTDLAVTERLAPLIPKDRLIVAESGVKDKADIMRMAAAGACAVLVGTAIMKSANIPGKLVELMT